MTPPKPEPNKPSQLFKSQFAALSLRMPDKGDRRSGNTAPLSILSFALGLRSSFLLTPPWILLIPIPLHQREVRSFITVPYYSLQPPHPSARPIVPIIPGDIDLCSCFSRSAIPKYSYECTRFVSIFGSIFFNSRNVGWIGLSALSAEPLPTTGNFASYAKDFVVM